MHLNLSHMLNKSAIISKQLEERRAINGIASLYIVLDLSHMLNKSAMISRQLEERRAINGIASLYVVLEIFMS